MSATTPAPANAAPAANATPVAAPAANAGVTPANGNGERKSMTNTIKGFFGFGGSRRRRMSRRVSRKVHRGRKARKVSRRQRKGSRRH